MGHREERAAAVTVTADETAGEEGPAGAAAGSSPDEGEVEPAAGEGTSPSTGEEASPLTAMTAEEFARTGRITPMLAQYFELKRTHPDCVLLYRLGDFYECFFEDARLAADVLDITLTGRGKGDERFPMAGIPHHAARGYIGRLVEAGHRVAICDQTEDASAAKGLVRREVVQVVTPGMVVDDAILDPREERLLGAVAFGEAGGALALLDLSTGAFRVAVHRRDAEIAEEILRAGLRELLVPEDVDPDRQGALVARHRSLSVVPREGRLFEPSSARRAVCHHLKVASLAGFGVPDGKGGDLLVSAAGAALRYAADAHREAAVHVDRLEVYDTGGRLVMDTATAANLEVLATLHGGKRQGSLLGLVDRSATAMGGRRIRQWLAWPLRDLEAISERQDAVAHLVDRPSLCDTVVGHLREMVDVERVLGRLALGQGSPRDLKGLARTLSVVPVLRAALQTSLVPQKGGLDGVDGAAAPPERLRALAEGLDGHPALAERLELALVDDPPATLRDGGFVRRGFDPELDALTGLATEGKDLLLRLEADERTRTGIASLKVRHNRVFGYYIEVTKPNLHLVPDHYVRKQTTANAERFVTEDLKAWEEKVVTAEEKRRALEQRIFEDLRGEVLEAAAGLRALADGLSDLDALLSLARVAVAGGWTRPDLDGSRDLLIEDGRHPVVEAALRAAGGEPYVPSDLVLEGERPLMIVTGPNMAGKSTVMRMAALVVLLAHVGSFVPARRARVGLTDRIFTRVGASDDLAGGRSTFMVEMTETAAILNLATDRSLVVLDEIGRGTSTFDGLSIAWAVAEDLHDRIRCRTLFATHYHELTDLSKERPGVVNGTVAVREWNGEVIFLRRLVDGAANRSYGIQVARLAGLPRAVLDRAAEVLANLESGELDEVGRPNLARRVHPGPGEAPASAGQLSLFGGRGPAPSGADRLLAEVDPDALSPREALELIYRLKSLLEE